MRARSFRTEVPQDDTGAGVFGRTEPLPSNAGRQPRSIIGQGNRNRDHASTQGSDSTRSSRSPDLCRQRSYEPDSYRAPRPCRLDSQTARQGPHDSSHLHAHAQCSLQVGQAHSSAPEVPPQLHRAHCTPQQARAGLAESAARCQQMLAAALGGGANRVKEFRRDGWAPAWPAGAEMLCYMDSSRSSSSRAGVHAGASARIPLPKRWSQDQEPGRSYGKRAGRGRPKTPTLRTPEIFGKQIIRLRVVAQFGFTLLRPRSMQSRALRRDLARSEY